MKHPDCRRRHCMSSPFPGMDPYVESPPLWSDFHASFITYWRDALIDCLPSNYEARIDEKVHLVEVSPPGANALSPTWPSASAGRRKPRPPRQREWPPLSP